MMMMAWMVLIALHMMMMMPMTIEDNEAHSITYMNITDEYIIEPGQYKSGAEAALDE